VHARLAVTVVVYELPWWVAATSTEPVPTLMLVPLTDDWPDGTSGSTSSRPLPSCGSTPSCWFTTGQSTP